MGFIVDAHYARGAPSAVAPLTPAAAFVALGAAMASCGRPMRRVLAAFLLLAPVTDAEVLTRTAGEFRVTADTALAFPGGVVSLTLSSRRPVASLAYGILDGQRCMFYPDGGDWRALVPVS